MSGEPEEQRQRKVTIYKPTRSAMTSATNKTKAWVMGWDKQSMWHNTCMGWNSGSDPKSGVKLRFDELDEAVNFAERNGWEYEILEPQQRRSFDGEKDYKYNFLFEHVCYDMDVNKEDPGRVTGGVFKHSARKSAWQNLGYTKRGHEYHDTSIDSDTDTELGSTTFGRKDLGSVPYGPRGGGKVVSK